MLSVKPDTSLPVPPDIAQLVHALTAEIKDQWWAYETRLPPLGRVYSPAEKKQREGKLRSGLNELSMEIKTAAGDRPSEAVTAAREERLLKLGSGLVQAAFNLEDGHISALRSYGFVESTREFARQARQFDPAISSADIYQAGRNAWSMNFFQLLLGLPVEVTPAVLAYSLLYPYTDNYLDNSSISKNAKMAFSERFRLRLEGQSVQAADGHEQKIFALVSMIEGQYDRQAHPHLYDSLLAIYRAQTNSLQMLQPHASPYELDLLGLGIEKGGTSVLADGLLVAGSLSLTQMRFMYHYGAFTQLLDDLEDVQADRKSGIMTVFSQTALHWPLDAITNRTIHFGLHFLERLDDFDQPGLEPFKEVLRMSLCPVMIDAAGQSGSLYSRPYLATLEEHFPFRFSFLKETRKRLNRQKLGIESLVEMLV